MSDVGANRLCTFGLRYSLWCGDSCVTKPVLTLHGRLGSSSSLQKRPVSSQRAAITPQTLMSSGGSIAATFERTLHFTALGSRSLSKQSAVLFAIVADPPCVYIAAPGLHAAITVATNARILQQSAINTTELQALSLTRHHQSPTPTHHGSPTYPPLPHR